MKLNGALLKDRRDELSLSQAEAARRCGVSLPTYNKAEGEGEMRPSIAKRILKGLRINEAQAVIPRYRGGDNHAA